MSAPKVPFIPPQLIVVLISALPVAELRAGIPVGIALGLSIEESAFWGIIGGILPVFFILKILGPISKWLMAKSSFFKKFFEHIFEKSRNKHSKKFQEIGAIFLILFTAIPLPGAGAWTGALLAFLFDIPYWKSIGLIFVGVVSMALIISLGISAFMHIPGFIQIFLK